MPSFAAPLVGPNLTVDLGRPYDLSTRIAFDARLPSTEELDVALTGALDALFDARATTAPLAAPTARAFGLPAATSRAVEAGPFVGDVRRGGSCNCEVHALTPHADGTHTEGVGHLLAERVGVVDLVDVALAPALVVTVAPRRLGGVGDAVVGRRDDDDRVVDRASLVDAWARAIRTARAAGLPTSGRGKPRALVVRTAPGEQRRRDRFSGMNPPYFTVDAAAWARSRGVAHLVVDLPSLDREDDGGHLGAHRAFFDLPARATTLTGPPPRVTITELAAVDAIVADGLYALSLQVAPIDADAAPSRPLLFALTAGTRPRRRR